MLKYFLMALVLATAPTALAEKAKLPPPVISEAMTLTQKTIPVLDSTMAYLEAGEGAPVLFIHGNPTSSFLWRNVMPHVADTHRAIAVDLIGMGASGKPDISYNYADHYAYLAAFIEALDLHGVTLVVHDWGAALGWDYARRNPSRISRIAFMEGVLPPAFPASGYEAMGEVGQVLKAMRDPAQGHQLVIEGNMFVEQMLPGFVNRSLGDEAMERYRAPFLDKEDRLPTLMWPRELPIGGEPAETTAMMQAVAAFMAETEMPTLLIYAEPGVLVPPQAVGWYTAHMRNLETAFAGQALHFLQEDQPDAIGRALDNWLRRD